jgi:hypothetical protein
LARGEADVDRRIWLLRIHNHGVVRLRNYELVVEALASVQAKILTISRG